jgi:uncharacterized protein involved in outer membrane biogenesis
MKKLLIIISGLAIMVGLGLYLIFSNLGSIIVAVVEEAGSEVTKVDVDLDKADIEFSSGKGSLSGLSVGNPPGFKTKKAFELNKISLAINTASLNEDIIVVKEVVIDRPHVTYEFGDKGSNIDQIQKNVEQSTGATQKSSKTAEKEDTDDKKVIIENLYIRNGKIDISGGLLGDKKMGAALPTIHLTNIGKEGGKATGATPAEVAKKVIDAITKQASKAVVNLGDLKNLIGGTFGNVEKGAGKAVGTVKEKAGGLLDKGKGLFGK